ncbi:MAG TPA: beta-eliminating lyase-related protein [Solirubrobacterales bacterium]
MSGFGSDNFAGVHPEVLEAIARANEGHAVAYGYDEWTGRAEAAFRRHFGDQARAFPVFNGTAANVLSLVATCETWQGAICTETAHLHVDECGAPERLAGVKLFPVATEHGKLDPGSVAARVARVGDEHAVQPRVVTISQATELGTVYTAAEVAALAEAAHERDLLLHVDGARLANAAASLGTSLGALTTEAGVDVVSFGGTKNGLLLGEAVVFTNPGLAGRFEFKRKQLGQLASKMRFISVQLEALLEGDLWRRNAEHANAMASRLAAAVEGADGVEIAHPVEANTVFPRLRAEHAQRLLERHGEEFPFYPWPSEPGLYRWMCAWDTTAEDVDRFAAAVAETASR